MLADALKETIGHLTEDSRFHTLADAASWMHAGMDGMNYAAESVHRRKATAYQSDSTTGYIVNVPVMPGMIMPGDRIPTVVLSRVARILRKLDTSPYSDHEENARLKERLEGRIAKAALSSSDTIMRYPPLPGFLISTRDVKPFVHSIVSVTYMDRKDQPRYRKGMLTDAWPVRLRIETLSGRAWIMQYGRILRIEVFKGKRLDCAIWYDGHRD